MFAACRLLITVVASVAVATCSTLTFQWNALSAVRDAVNAHPNYGWVRRNATLCELSRWACERSVDALGWAGSHEQHEITRAAIAVVNSGACWVVGGFKPLPPCVADIALPREPCVLERYPRTLVCGPWWPFD